MDASRRRNSKKEYYIEGSNVRPLSTMPAYQPDRREYPDVQKNKPPVRKKVKRVASVMEQSRLPARWCA